jgi:hypothetical protein
VRCLYKKDATTNKNPAVRSFGTKQADEGGDNEEQAD